MLRTRHSSTVPQAGAKVFKVDIRPSVIACTQKGLGLLSHIKKILP